VVVMNCIAPAAPQQLTLPYWLGQPGSWQVEKPVSFSCTAMSRNGETL